MKKIFLFLYIVLIALIFPSCKSSESIYSSISVNEKLFEYCLPQTPKASINGKEYFINKNNMLCCDDENNIIWDSDYTAFICELNNNVIFSEINILDTAAIYCIDKNSIITKISDEGAMYLVCDDRYVYYLASRSKNTSESITVIYRMDPDGSNVTQLYVSDGITDFSVYNNYVYFSISHSASSEKKGIYKISINGGKKELITDEWFAEPNSRLYIEDDVIYGLSPKNKDNYTGETTRFAITVTGDFIASL